MERSALFLIPTQSGAAWISWQTSARRGLLAQLFERHWACCPAFFRKEHSKASLCHTLRLWAGSQTQLGCRAPSALPGDPRSASVGKAERLAATQLGPVPPAPSRLDPFVSGALRKHFPHRKSRGLDPAIHVGPAALVVLGIRPSGIGSGAARLRG